MTYITETGAEVCKFEQLTLQIRFSETVLTK
jgi:hypothetical protein